MCHFCHARMYLSGIHNVLEMLDSRLIHAGMTTLVHNITYEPYSTPKMSEALLDPAPKSNLYPRSLRMHSRAEITAMISALSMNPI